MTFDTLTKIKRTTTHESLGDLASELTRMQATKRDYVVDTRRMTFSSTVGIGANLAEQGAGSWLTFDSSDPRDEGVGGGKLNDYAHNQIAQRLDVPRKYYDRMRAEAPELLDRNVLHWLHATQQTRLVRMLDGNVRAFLSDRFRRLDNYDLVERAVIPALTGIDGLTFHVADLTPERMTLRAILPGLEREITVGQIVQAGVQVKNSEVGAGACAIEAFVWKLDCLNGLVSNVGRMRTHHVGRRVADDEESRELYQRDTLRADDRAFYLKARDSIKAAVTSTQFDVLVADMREATTGVIVERPVEATKVLAATFDLGDGEQESVLASLARGGDFSRWGMVNAITDAAKNADTFDRQEELERVGGELLTVRGSKWDAIALAR